MARTRPFLSNMNPESPRLAVWRMPAVLSRDSKQTVLPPGKIRRAKGRLHKGSESFLNLLMIFNDSHYIYFSLLTVAVRSGVGNFFVRGFDKLGRSRHFSRLGETRTFIHESPRETCRVDIYFAPTAHTICNTCTSHTPRDFIFIFLFLKAQNVPHISKPEEVLD